MRDSVKRSGDQPLAGSVLAKDQHVCVRGSNAFDDFEDGPHCRRVGDEFWSALVVSQHAVFVFEALASAEGLTKIGLGAKDGLESCVVPGFLDEVTCAAAHCFDGYVHVSPGGHDDYGKG